MKNKPCQKPPDHVITARAREVVKEIAESGVSMPDIARLTDTTVLSLLENGTPILKRPQFVALSTHFGVSLYYLWTGLGPKFLPKYPTLI